MLPKAPTAASGVRKLGDAGVVEQHARLAHRGVAHPARQQRLAQVAGQQAGHRARDRHRVDARLGRVDRQDAVDLLVGGGGADRGHVVFGPRRPRRRRSGRRATRTSGSIGFSAAIEAGDSLPELQADLVDPVGRQHARAAAVGDEASRGPTGR